MFSASKLGKILYTNHTTNENHPCHYWPQYGLKHSFVPSNSCSRLQRICSTLTSVHYHMKIHRSMSHPFDFTKKPTETFVPTGHPCFKVQLPTLVTFFFAYLNFISIEKLSDSHQKKTSTNQKSVHSSTPQTQDSSVFFDCNFCVIRLCVARECMGIE